MMLLLRCAVGVDQFEALPGIQPFENAAVTRAQQLKLRGSL